MSSLLVQFLPTTIYGGVYIGTAILWLWLVEGITPSIWDIVGSGITLLGMAIIMFGNKS